MNKIDTLNGSTIVCRIPNFIEKFKADCQKHEAKFKLDSEKTAIKIDLIELQEIDVPFPMVGMPAILSNYVNDLSAVYGSPKEFFAMANLGACCGVVRKRAVIDSGKYKNYAQLWLMYVAPSGTGKTEPDKKGFKRISEFDSELYKSYQQELKNWHAECVICKKQKTVEPIKPIRKQYLIDDSTPEALYYALQNNEGLTLHSDELNTWFSNIGRYAKSGEVGRYLSIFDNTTFDISRKGDEPIFVEEPYMNIIGGIQPEVLAETLQLNQMRKNGFSQRFVFAYPQSVIKPYYNDKSPNQQFLKDYENLIDYLRIGEFGTLTLTTEAKKVFVDFSDELTDKANGSKKDYLKSMYSKFEIHCLRLSLILELIKSFPEGLKTNTVSAETLIYAIELCRYFIACGLKVERLGDANNQNGKIGMPDVAKFLVEKCGQSQTSTAKLLNVSQQYVNKILRSP